MSYPAPSTQEIRQEFQAFATLSIAAPNALPSPLEELHFLFVLLRRFFCFERAQVPPLAGFRVLLSGVEPIFAAFEFANHRDISSSQRGAAFRAKVDARRVLVYS
jgi:hypothetical protein